MKVKSTLLSTLSLLFVLIANSVHAKSPSGRDRYLSQVALENLRSLEASHMVYPVYESFIVPRICQNDKEIIGGKNKKACRIFGHVDEADFEKVPGDSTGILYRATKLYTRTPNFKFTGSTPELVAAAPKGYKVSYVACYRREKIRNTPSECSLFFMILEATHSRLPPILAVKGSSHGEDWKNNLLAGAPILKEITSVFTTVLRELRISVIQGSSQDQIPENLAGISDALSKFFLDITAKSDRIIFTGHSLGGALTQELARQVFIATRSSIDDPRSGPQVHAITWNGLSYTSMIGRLRKALSKLDIVSRAGWKQEDSTQLENFKKLFDGVNLSAVNFHTADDALTQIVNHSIIGKLLRYKEHNTQVQAGGDILLSSNRFVGVNSLKAKVAGHSTVNTLKDALFSSGVLTEAKQFKKSNSISEQVELLNKLNQIESQKAITKSTPKYLRDNFIDDRDFDEEKGINFHKMELFEEVNAHKKRAEIYDDMQKTLVASQNYFGRLLEEDLDQLSEELYR